MYGGDLEDSTYAIKDHQNNNRSICSKNSYPNSQNDDSNEGSDYWLDEALDDDEYELFNNLASSNHISATPTVNNHSDDDDASQNDSSEPEADQLQLSENAVKALMRPHQLHSIY